MERETQFIKRVVYLMRAHTQRPWWHMFIPFKFLLEHLARRRDFRAFSGTHLYLKQIALSAAYRDVKTGNPDIINSETEARIRDYRVHVQKIKSAEIYELLTAWVNLLRDHYRLLLSAEGRSYFALVKNAYSSEKEYQEFFARLKKIEAKIDATIMQTETNLEKLTYFNERKEKSINEARERESKPSRQKLQVS